MGSKVSLSDLQAPLLWSPMASRHSRSPLFCLCALLSPAPGGAPVLLEKGPLQGPHLNLAISKDPFPR